MNFITMRFDPKKAKKIEIMIPKKLKKKNNEITILFAASSKNLFELATHIQ